MPRFQLLEEYVEWRQRSRLYRGSRVTIGFEFEFYSPRMAHEEEGDSFVARLALALAYHRDYYDTMEVVSPPIGLDKHEYLPLLNEIEEAIDVVFRGVRVSDYYDPVKYGQPNSCGTHMHVRVNVEAGERYKMMARMHNWLVVLTPLIAPLITMGRVLDVPSKEVYEVPGTEYGFRSRAFHYGVKPMMISAREVRLFENSSGYSRGYEPVDGANEWYAVELNRYRKSTTTIEVRLTETHWLAGYAMAEMAWELSRKTPPPYIDLDRLYRSLETVRIEYNPRHVIEVYGVPISGVSVEVRVWKADKLLFTRDIAATVGYQWLAERLSEAVGDRVSEVTAKLLDTLAKNRRLTYMELHSLARKAFG